LKAFTKRQRRAIRKYFGHTRPFDRLKVGIEYVLQQRRRQREEAFGELRQSWEHLCRRSQWQKLIDLVQVRAGGCSQEQKPDRRGKPEAPSTPTLESSAELADGGEQAQARASSGGVDLRQSAGSEAVGRLHGPHRTDQCVVRREVLT